MSHAPCFNLFSFSIILGPISVAIYSTPLQFYESGIFDGECSGTVDHEVLAVGFMALIATWGEGAYFKLKMGTNLCGVAQGACYAMLGSDGNLINTTPL